MAIQPVDVYCNNSYCQYHNVNRQAWPINQGGGIYQWASVYCECGWPVVGGTILPPEEPTPEEPAPSDPVVDVTDPVVVDPNG